jgi:hypothetical protein
MVFVKDSLEEERRKGVSENTLAAVGITDD